MASRGYDAAEEILVLAPSQNPNPGPGFLLEDYSWDEKSGFARLKYRRRGDATKRATVDHAQPAGPQHEGWEVRRDADRAEMFARYAEALRTTREMHRVGAYGR